MKACTKCGVVKAVGQFSKDSSKRDGLQSRCKECNSEYRAANLDKIKAKDAKYYANNLDKHKSAHAKWRSENLGRVRAAAIKWNAANPERVKAYTVKWQSANPEAVRIIGHNRRSRKLSAGGKLSKDLAERLFKLQRGKCACCGEPLGKNFHLDHIMPIKLGGANTDDNIQLLRQRCNNKKSAKHPIDFMQSRGFLL